MDTPAPDTNAPATSPPPAEAGGLSEANKGDPSTHFTFLHRIFQIDNCRFSLNGNDKLPCFYVPMGEQVAAIELAKLQQEFGIPNESPDAAILKQVEKGLKYVREIRPGDSIPREILDGSASWSVEPEHKDLALAKLNMELIFWISGFRGDMPSLKEMQKIQKEPEGRGQIRDANVKLSQLLNLKDPRAAATRLEEVARETPYIEALRDRSAKMGEIIQKLSALANSFKKETAFIAEVMRMQDLMRRAVRIVADKFGAADNVLKEIPKVVGDTKATIAVVREVRDDINLELKKWDDYFAPWSEMKIERSEQNEKFFRRFYQFLAENYMEQASWGNKDQKKK